MRARLFPIVSVIIGSIPSCIIGGISFVLYGMISAIGVRNVVENKVDFTKSRNLIVAAVILVCALGLSSDTVSFTIGSAAITLSPLAVASIAGIVLNAVFPGKDYKFDTEDVADAIFFAGFLKIDREWAENILYRYKRMKHIEKLNKLKE